MGKFTSIALGAISGAAAAVFLASKKGQEVVEQVSDLIQDWQEDPQTVKENLTKTVTDFSNQAVESVKDVKEKVNNGDITVETVVQTVKDKTQDVMTFSQETFSRFQEGFPSSDVDGVKEVLDPEEESQDIIIDLEVVDEDPAEK